MRYFIEISYKGTHYHGWQMQPNARSIQECINVSLSTLLKQEINIVGSGRTDTGVHALQQYAHFDTSVKIEPQLLAYQCNALLDNDLCIQRIIPVHDDAHARFDATSRAYEYYLSDQYCPFLNGMVYFLKEELNTDLMNQAANRLIGTRDFRSFSKTKTQVKHYICTISKAKWVVDSDNIWNIPLLIFKIRADRFLRGMVRAIVGSLLDVGSGKSKPEAFEAIIAAQDRSAAGRNVPAHGLYLKHIEYDFIND